MNFEIIDSKNMDFGAIDKTLLDEAGRLKLMSSEDYKKIDRVELRAWANLRGRYVLPTTELVQWLNTLIGGRTAIEVGAGYGDLGFHLGIPMTDSYQQIEDPVSAAMYRLIQHEPTRPPKDVLREDAESAVERIKPQVVVGAFLTELFNGTEGNYKGPRYGYIIERCETFVLVGNERIHGRSNGLRFPHQTYSFPWLVTRSSAPELNRIWVFDRKK